MVASRSDGNWLTKSMQTATPGATADPETVRLLLVEDDPSYARLVQDMLAESGGPTFDVRYAPSLTAALQEVLHGDFSAVILDLGLPDSKGIDGVTKLRKQAPELPVVVLSGQGDSETIFEAMREGAQDYIVKEHAIGPLLVRCVRHITERKSIETRLAQSLQQLQRTLDGTIHALASTVELRDPYTAGHQARVAGLACAIAEKMDLARDQIHGIRVASVLHDIGKIAVPAEILNKPAPLSDLEHRMIRMHPQMGFDILESVEFPWPVAKAVRQHHERLDGSGYPDALEGEAIALDARILSVADVVEAMSCHRPYRAALGIDRTLEELMAQKDIRYDARVVQQCVKLFVEDDFQWPS